MTAGVAAPSDRRSWVGGSLAYSAMVAAAVAAFVAIDRIGGPMAFAGTAPPFVATSVPQEPTLGVLPHVLITLIAVIVVGQLLGRLFRNVGQPPVIGEVLAGILLGPSLLGRVWPDASAFLLPKPASAGRGRVGPPPEPESGGRFR